MGVYVDWLIVAGIIGFCLLVAIRKVMNGPIDKAASSAPVSERTGKAPPGSQAAFVRNATAGTGSSEDIVGAWAPPARQPRRDASNARWVQPGETVEISGYKISGGMIYVGTNLPSMKGGMDKCLVNPKLKVATSSPDWAGHRMPYWPSYADIPPTCRMAYLQWLAGGRKDPNTGIGYVFLFFYGLERRFFVDGAKGEAQAITAEVRRLLSIYGSNNSFKTYAGRFLEAAGAFDIRTDASPPLPTDLGSGFEMSIHARAYLGQRLADGKALSADDALLWVLSMPDCRLGMVGVRCLHELTALWRVRFAERYPTGLRIESPMPRRQLALLYRAASGTFDATIELGAPGTKLPDITALASYGAVLKGLLDTWSNDLVPYARLLGRKPEARGTVEALAVLPRELATVEGSPVKALVDRVEALFGGHSIAPVTVPKLAGALGIGFDPSKMTAVRNQIASVLDRFDIGFEPDRRYGSAGLSHDGRAVLFRSPGGAQVDADRPVYKATRAMIDVTVLAASADGTVDAEEYRTLRDYLKDAPDLSDPERLRLLAYSALMVKDGPKQQSVLSKLAALPEADRRQIAQTAIATSLADGHASPSEVKFLEKLYKALGFGKEDLYLALHRGAVVIDEPVTVAAEERTTGIRIPSPPDAKEGDEAEGIRIDVARLERIRSETSAVSALLAGIFVEEEPPQPPAPLKAEEQGKVHSFKGLDAPHGELLATVLASGSLDRAAFESRSRALRLLPDGAFETINEWGFDTFDEAVLEGDDPIVVVDHLRTELENMEIVE